MQPSVFQCSLANRLIRRNFVFQISLCSLFNELIDFTVVFFFLQLDALSQSPTMNNLILLTTTETSTLLAQVSTLPVEIY